MSMLVDALDLIPFLDEIGTFGFRSSAKTSYNGLSPSYWLDSVALTRVSDKPAMHMWVIWGRTWAKKLRVSDVKLKGGGSTALILHI